MVSADDKQTGGAGQDLFNPAKMNRSDFNSYFFKDYKFLFGMPLRQAIVFE